ncbi:MAG: restriction endonuclease subunit S [Acidobacteria bacterium]|nr:restriction endonuclease subunit S [Acidobacteriota bacterium]
MSNKMEEKMLKPAAQHALKPKLRFPEFRDAGEWDAKELTDLIEVVTPPKKIPTTQYSATGSYPIIDQSQAYISGWTDDQDAVISRGLPLIVFGDHTCVLKITDAPFAQGADGIKIFHASSGVSTSYLYQHLLLNPVKMEEYKRHFSILKRKLVAFPEEKFGEQQKIADCLSSLDELITTEAKKLDTLKTHKKGLMQQLFPAEDETLPKLRFPEFRDAGEWEEKRIEELAKRGSGHTPNKIKPGYYNGGIKWVSLADSKRLDNGYIYETKIEISKEGLKNSSAVLHPPGTVIVSRDAGVGKSAILHSAMAVSQHFIVWLCDKSKLSNWFLYYFLQTLKPKFENIAMGSTIKTIGLPYFKEICITIPSPPEQQKIADCLSSIDELITAQTQKLDALKAHKKGLMQQLFPAFDEVKG